MNLPNFVDHPLVPVVFFIAAAGGISWLLNFVMIRLGPALGLLDQPGARRVHTTPIPRAGGIAVWLSFAIVSLLATHFVPSLLTRTGFANLHAFLIASLLLLVVGIYDDRNGMRASVKLVAQIAAAVLYHHLSPGHHGAIWGVMIPPWLDLLIFTMWAVLLINAFNLIDGLDGLCGGLSAISLSVLAVLCLVTGSYDSALLVGFMAASIAGFLYFNLNPARIFLGDAGSMMLGLFLASASTYAGGRRVILGAILLPIAIAGVPLLDVALAVWRRSVRKLIAHWSRGDSVGIFAPDKDHLHHRLLETGMTQKKVALSMQALAVVISALCFVPLIAGPKALSVTVVGFVLLTLFGLRHIAHVELIQTGTLVHLAVKRRPAKEGARRLYFIYDIVTLAVAASLALAIESNLGARGMGSEWNWRFVMTFVSVGFVALNLLYIYKRVWLRASFAEYLKVGLGIGMAGLVSCLLFQVGTGELAWSVARTGVLSLAFAIPLILLPRALPDIFRELSLDSAHKGLTKNPRQPNRQVLVYGAGDIGCLFIRHLAHGGFPAVTSSFKVAGFLDDNPMLYQRLINGFKVHGGLDHLSRLAKEYPIHGIIITAREIPPERMEKLVRLSQLHGFELYSWGREIGNIHDVNGGGEVEGQMMSQ